MEEEKVNNNVSEGSQSQPVTTPSIPVAMIAPTMNTGNHNGVTTTTATTTVTTMTIPLDISGKKKRGRPRKYDSDGKLNVKYQSAKSAPAFTFSPTSPNRGSGRSFDSTNWLLFSPSFGEVFANSAGWDFTPFMVTVNTGQDVSGMIMSFAQKGPGGICIMSANGSVSNVALRQRDSAGGIVTYEGRFEILSLCGSFIASENSDIRSQSGGLSVSLSAPDGSVIGGPVAGLLTAAGPIQMVIGSFIPNGYTTHKRKQHQEHTVASPISFGPATVSAAGPISQANPTNVDAENSLMTMSQLPEQIQSEPVSVTTSGDTQNIDTTPNAATWNGSDEFSGQRVSPDINLSLPDE